MWRKTLKADREMRINQFNVVNFLICLATAVTYRHSTVDSVQPCEGCDLSSNLSVGAKVLARWTQLRYTGSAYCGKTRLWNLLIHSTNNTLEVQRKNNCLRSSEDAGSNPV